MTEVTMTGSEMDDDEPEMKKTRTTIDARPRVDVNEIEMKL